MKKIDLQDKMVTSDRVLCTPSSFARNHLLYLQEIGTLQAVSTHTSKRSRLASFLFFCVKSGSGTLDYEGCTYSLNTGDCVFLDCNKPYSHNTSDDLWCLQWAHFDGPHMPAIYNKYIAEHSSPVFRPNSLKPYEVLLTELQELTSAENNAKELRISEKLTSLLARITTDYEALESPKILPLKSLVLTDIKTYLEEHFREKITLDLLSKHFYIDKYYLTRRFKQYYGTTVNAYLQHLKISHAKHLLRFSELSIEEISEECGIEDANYFARLFKKIEGTAPGEFRRNWRGKK